MKQIIALLIFFCSCTSSYKLTDAKYTPDPGAIITTDGQIIYSKTTGYRPLKLAQQLTPPSSVGTYAITASVYPGESAELMAARMHLKVVIVCGIAFLILFIISFIVNKLKPIHETDN